jgi:hypothetical protein
MSISCPAYGGSPDVSAVYKSDGSVLTGSSADAFQLTGRTVTVDPQPQGIEGEGNPISLNSQRECGKWCDGRYLTYLADNGVGSGLPQGLTAYWPMDGSGEDRG